MDRMEPQHQQPQDDEPKNIWEDFGIPKPEYEDERNAPPVDRQALRALIDRKLPEEEVRKLYGLTLRFRSWAQAMAELDAESLKEDLKDNPEGSWDQ